jgi:hypothetical protein
LWGNIHLIQKDVLIKCFYRNVSSFLATIVYMDDPDEYAKRFDNFMYGIMLAQIMISRLTRRRLSL